MTRCDYSKPAGGCSTSAEYSANLSIPVCLKPSAAIQGVSVSCAGEPSVVSSRRESCCGRCSTNSRYNLVITQPITVTITVCCSADAASGEAGFCPNL